MKEYPKGKDLKQKGDCLTHLFIKKIENISGSTYEGFRFNYLGTPEGFDKW